MTQTQLPYGEMRHPCSSVRAKLDVIKDCFIFLLRCLSCRCLKQGLGVGLILTAQRLCWWGECNSPESDISCCNSFPPQPGPNTQNELGWGKIAWNNWAKGDTASKVQLLSPVNLFQYKNGSSLPTMIYVNKWQRLLIFSSVLAWQWVNP